MVTERDVRVDGVHVHYAEAGAGPALVLVPGQSMPWQSYQRVIPILAERFHVYAVDVRGHGKSEHTPGHYTFGRCGEDLIAFLRDVVQEPAICTGNSSGGLIALYAAAKAPELVRALLAEDPPLFSAEWPRLRDGCWVHSFFTGVVAALDKEDLAGLFSTMRLPTRPGAKLMSFPPALTWVLGGAIRRRQRANPTAPVDIWWLPLAVRLFVRGLSEYDVEFTRACLDGSMCDIDHAALLAAVRCPMTLIKAASFVDDKLGLVGAMSDDDVARAQTILPALVVQKVAKPHVVHVAAPKTYVAAVDALAARA